MTDQQLSFAHLHLHTEFSFLDGIIRVKELMENLKANNMNAVAITDHGTMHGVVEFYNAARNASVHPVIGCEVYVAPRGRKDRGYQDCDGTGSYVDIAGGGQKGHYHHLVLLAKNNTGYKNLIELCSRAYLEGFYYKPRVDKELLEQYSEGVFALSACLAGEIPGYILAGYEDLAKAAIKKYQKIFGEENFFLEVQHNKIPEQQKVNDALLHFHKELGAPMVATNDCHYLNPEDAELQKVMLCLQIGKTIKDEVFGFDTDEFYVKTPQEMSDALGQYPGAIENTFKIATHCNVELNLNTQQLHMPAFSKPEGFEGTTNDYLRELAYQGAWERFGSGPLPTVPPPNPDEKLHLERPLVKAIVEHLPNEVVERLDYELGVIERMGYTTYFLIVWDFIRFARDSNISVGPGRGSAAGSLVAFCLRITDIDPLKLGLIFERFLNPDRISPPDIDTDFCDKRRSEVIEYCSRKYGREQVSQIATFARMKARAVIKDVGRVLGFSVSDCEKITKLMDNLPTTTTLKEVFKSHHSSAKSSPEQRSAAESLLYVQGQLNEIREQSSDSRKLFDYAIKLENSVRQSGVHAAGIIIAGDNLKQWTPLMKTKDDQVCTQFEQQDLESMGLMKMDFLGLRTLSVLEDALRHLSAQGITVDLNNLPETDPATFEMLSRGKTNGVFQLESAGMKTLIKNLKPTCFQDMVPLVALYRPGPLQSGMVEDFVNRKHGKAPITYPHPVLEPILKETYGVILYQEQVMHIAAEYSGLTLAQADEMRRAMGKKKVEAMKQMKQLFVEGAKNKHKVKPEDAKNLFLLIEKFAGYGFNKSHSAAYGLVAFQTAYIKANYPREFLAAMLSNEMGNTDKVVKYVNECREWGIAVLPPDINQSKLDFTVTPHGIRFGLRAIKGVGESGIEALLAERNEHGPFKSLQDFCERIDLGQVNQKRIEGLIRCGAMDSFGLFRSQLLEALPRVVQYAINVQRDRKIGQASLFEALPEDEANQDIRFADMSDLSPRQKLADEKALIGFYITGHPLDHVKPQIQRLASHSYSMLAEQIETQKRLPVRFCGIISQLKKRRDRNGAEMASFLLEDLEGVVEVVVFASVLETCTATLADEQIVMVEGLADHGRDLEVNIRASTIVDLDLAFEQNTTALTINLGGLENNTTLLADLRKAVLSHPGKSRARFVVPLNDQQQVVFTSGTKFNFSASPQFINSIAQVLDPGRLQFEIKALNIQEQNGYPRRNGSNYRN